MGGGGGRELLLSGNRYFRYKVSAAERFFRKKKKRKSVKPSLKTCDEIFRSSLNLSCGDMRGSLCLDRVFGRPES